MAPAAFMRLLGAHGVPVIDYPAADLERELFAVGTGPCRYIGSCRPAPTRSPAPMFGEPTARRWTGLGPRQARE
jgi:hypothetical protein